MRSQIRGYSLSLTHSIVLVNGERGLVVVTGINETNTERTLMLKIKEEGQRCRHCKTPVVKRVGRGRLHPNQKYYFGTYLFCPKCRATYFQEKEKIFVDGTSSRAQLFKNSSQFKDRQPKKSTQPNRDFRKKIMAFYRSLPEKKKELFESDIENLLEVWEEFTEKA